MKLINWRAFAAKHNFETTAAGNVFVIESVAIPQLRRKRNVWIYLPPDYQATTRRYPVLYMHDGQNLFDAATAYAGEWSVDKTLNRLFVEQSLPGLIVVGVENGSAKRMEEYIPGQAGAHYAAFLTDTLKPQIDRLLRTIPGREATGVAGSSLGGLLSLYLGLTRPDVFSKVGAFSPAMHFAGDAFHHLTKTAPLQLYLDVGTKEMLPYTGAKKYADQVWDSYYALLAAGFDNSEVRFVVEKDAPHNEAAWAGRFAAAVLWLYGGTPVQ